MELEPALDDFDLARFLHANGIGLARKRLARHHAATPARRIHAAETPLRKSARLQSTPMHPLGVCGRRESAQWPSAPAGAAIRTGWHDREPASSFVGFSRCANNPSWDSVCELGLI